MGSLADRLQVALDAREMTPADFARETGAGSGRVSKWMNGEQKPGPEALAKICRVLRVSGHWLLTDEGQMEPPETREISVVEQARREVGQEVRQRIKAAVDGALQAMGSTAGARQIAAAGAVAAAKKGQAKRTRRPPRTPPAEAQG